MAVGGRSDTELVLAKRSRADPIAAAFLLPVLGQTRNLRWHDAG